MAIIGQADSRTTRRIPAVAFVACCLIGSSLAFGADFEERKQRLAGLPVAFDPGVLPSTTPARITTPSRPTLTPSRAVQPQGFLERHLMPRVSQQLERVTPILTLESESAEWQNSRMHSWFSGTAEDRASRGLRRAAKAYFVEETAVGPLIESLRVSRDGFGRVARPRTGTDLGLRLSHGRPQLDVRRRSYIGTTRFGVGLDGSLGIEFRPARSETGSFAAGYDVRESRFSLSFRHSH